VQRTDLCYELHLAILEDSSVEALVTRERDLGQMQLLGQTVFTRWADPRTVTRWFVKEVYRDLCAEPGLSPF
jgi:hypothetical protein